MASKLGVLGNVVVSAVVSLVVAVLASVVFWLFVERPRSNELERQDNALVAFEEGRVTLAAFRKGAPKREEKYAKGNALWREGRRLLFREDYAEALERFEEARELLVGACRACPGLYPAPP